MRQVSSLLRIMSARFSVQPIGRFAGASQPVKRPKEFACFSYDDNHEFHLDDSSLKYYYTPQLGADLSKGFDTFQKLDDTGDDHLDSLLKTIAAHEQETGKKIDANIVTWRGMMTKIMAAPFDQMDGFEMNATLYQDCIFIEENNAYKIASRSNEGNNKRRRGPPLEVMQFWGYKFETLSTLPAPWAETSRDFIENRENEAVNNKAQYCSVVRTGIGKSVLCLGGEVDAIWDSKPEEKGSPINWVELKTSAEIRNPGGMENFKRKLMKYWIQSFLLGVPRIVVGFRTQDGILVEAREMETHRIPDMVNADPNPKWNADMCVNFAATFLEWLTENINDEGVWRIRREPQSPTIELFKVEETGHGDILSDEFKNWRIKLALGPSDAS
ncbi:protein RAI1 [Fusarium oxysporum f. sp. raphani 54005]|nr:protein RAI1 [Fusarium oxysporum f. sp. lycopersici 4287]XP_031069987.1 protein RAI1 [Fusarium odoratissimum NRRL 54006]EWZ45434.1 protein RAI1 [Fusarium oxysporum Fo47]EWZ97746.1 protein RAI1 [Fusarium oxysporum f. sp. lycopersici MN25]EXK42834.1 protein RAI1 [Fusarium oxysporum f. sp. melonis 26406]EXK99916.1 protein RAI1 [Fusarium oxysporum f. sp. raphani 54005]EXL62783.1 protein RAI1 [Fusarium oxysporum f. sp. radicis-lycopersici 26381]EXL82228.1 protein RAI1 [Fusarium oxysporum f. sp